MTANVAGPIWEIVPFSVGQQFTSADTTTKKTLVTAGSNGSRVDMIACDTNDTTAVNLAFYIGHSGTDYYIGNVSVPIGSGYTTVIRVEAIATLSPVLGYIALGPSDTLKVNCVATMTAAKTTDVVAMGGDY